MATSTAFLTLALRSSTFLVLLHDSPNVTFQSSGRMVPLRLTIIRPCPSLLAQARAILPSISVSALSPDAAASHLLSQLQAATHPAFLPPLPAPEQALREPAETELSEALPHHP